MRMGSGRLWPDEEGVGVLLLLVVVLLVVLVLVLVAVIVLSLFVPRCESPNNLLVRA